MVSLLKILTKEDIDSLHSWIVNDEKIAIFQDQIWQYNDKYEPTKKVEIKVSLSESRDIIERDREKIIAYLLKEYNYRDDNFVYNTKDIKDAVILIYVIFRSLNPRDWGKYYDSIGIYYPPLLSPDTALFYYIKMLNLHNQMYWAKDRLAFAIFRDMLTFKYSPRDYKKIQIRYDGESDVQAYRLEFTEKQNEIR